MSKGRICNMEGRAKSLHRNRMERVTFQYESKLGEDLARWIAKILLKEMSPYSHHCSSVALKDTPKLGKERMQHEL